MKKAGKLTALLLALIMVLGLAACGNSSTSAASTTPGGSTDTSATESVRLVYWSMWNETEPQAQVITEATEAFMATHPGVTIDIQWNGREIRKTLQPAIEAGTTIDLWDEDLERVTKNWSGYAIELDSYLDKSYESIGGVTYESLVNPAMLDMARFFSETGSVYAVPYQPMIVAVFYNRDLFAQAGITSAPTTWEEMEEACAKLVAAGITPLTIDDYYMDLPFSYHLARLKGTEWVSQLVNDKTGEMWDDPAVLQAAKDYENFASKGYFSPNVASNVYPNGQYEVANGNVAMFLLNGTWLPNEVRSVAGEDFAWGAFAYPNVAGGVDDIYDNVYGAQAFQISKACANPDVAFEYIAYITTGEWDVKMSVDTIGAPMGTNAEWPAEIADLKDILDNAETVYPWSCGFGDNPDVLAVMVSGFTRLISGQLSAEDLVASLKDASMK